MGREMERALRDFVALRTVSRDPAFREDCFQARAPLPPPSGRDDGLRRVWTARGRTSTAIFPRGGRSCLSRRRPRNPAPPGAQRPGGGARAQGAKYIAALLESLGAEIKMAHGPRDDSNPVVLGRIGRDPSRPTILFYGAPPPRGFTLGPG